MVRAGLEPVSGILTVTERHPEPGVIADFGSLHEIAPSERQAHRPEGGRPVCRATEASWAAFDELSGTAPGHLRKGPRGGGRDTGQIVRHVRDADAMSARKMGLPRDKAATDDPVAALRARIAAPLRDPQSLVTPQNGWPLRYAARRIGWHVLDHLWEIETQYHREETAVHDQRNAPTARSVYPAAATAARVSDRQ
ncbi:MAG: hypothetical protein ACRDOK_08205 [Streptosporangiaceae bacterium]